MGIENENTHIFCHFINCFLCYNKKKDALGKLQQVGESFTEANKLLLATESTITGYCGRMAKVTNATMASCAKNIASLGGENKDLAGQIETAKKDLQENGKDMQEE